MAEFIRSQYRILKERIEEPRRFIQVIAGPRQVGKSTLVSQVLSSMTIPYSSQTADDINRHDSDWITRVWDSARAAMSIRNESEHLLVIDEIQKIDNWSEVVKKEWDTDSRAGLNMKVVILGSSRLLLKKGLTESLAGRFELIRMGHWTFPEMREAFGMNLDRYIYFGGYPGAAGLIGDERRWRKYIKDSLVAPTIEKDVIMTSGIYKPVLMKRLFELGCSYSSEQVSLTKMIGQLQDAGNVTTLAGYLDILTQCSLLTGLQKYAADNARKYNSIPKFCVFNNALMTAYSGKSFEVDRLDTQRWGRWVESAVGSYLLNFADENEYRVFYWRDGNNEVDYVVLTDEGLVALEVKSGRRGMNSGVPRFKELFKPRKSYVIGTNGIPLDDFFSCDISKILF